MTPLVMVVLGKFFDWRGALVIVKPETFIRWHSVPHVLALEIEETRTSGLAGEHQSVDSRDGPRESHLGQERIANELNLKLGIKVSPRTVQKYLRNERPRGTSGQRWSTFVRSHAKAIVACDFLTVATVNFCVLYVFLTMEVDSRRILHLKVTEYPTAEWATRNLRRIVNRDKNLRSWTASPLQVAVIAGLQ
jgi:hypothetical protein